MMENESNFFIYAIIGCIFLISYSLFAFYVTRHGDFYKTRRWKAAIWVSILSGVLLMVIVIISVGGTIGNNSLLLNNPSLLFGTMGDNVLQWFKDVIITLSLFLPCLTPFLFIVTFATYYKLKWWLNSDDYLDKIWKDPNRGNKSPLQWL